LPVKVTKTEDVADNDSYHDDYHDDSLAICDNQDYDWASFFVDFDGF